MASPYQSPPPASRTASSARKPPDAANVTPTARIAISSLLMLSANSSAPFFQHLQELVKIIPSTSANPFKVHRPLWNRAGRGQQSAVAAVVLPRAGLRGDVLHLPFLLPGPPILRRAMPPESTAATTARRQPAAPAKPGGTARSPRPATGLPGTPPPRDGSYFRRAWPVRQHQEAIDGNGNQHAIGGGGR